ncbi:MAG: hypothetical protein OSJ72_03160 [Lachnospiraceae bacterium]|nr:hypothetical protein [Lachnospiraceae bacterium]
MKKIIVVELLNAAIIVCLCWLFRLGIVSYRKGVKKQLSYYKLLLNWNLSDTGNEKLGAILSERGYKNVMIYGAGDLGKILYHKINSSVNVCAFIEKNPNSGQMEDIPILSCNDAKLKMGEIDCIIVTPFFDFEAIRQELSMQDNKISIIPLDTLIHDL